jgi:hypothetical protein
VDEARRVGRIAIHGMAIGHADLTH